MTSLVLSVRTKSQSSFTSLIIGVTLRRDRILGARDPLHSKSFQPDKIIRSSTTSLLEGESSHVSGTIRKIEDPVKAKREKLEVCKNYSLCTPPHTL